MYSIYHKEHHYCLDCSPRDGYSDCDLKTQPTLYVCVYRYLCIWVCIVYKVYNSLVISLNLCEAQETISR